MVSYAAAAIKASSGLPPAQTTATTTPIVAASDAPDASAGAQPATASVRARSSPVSAGGVVHLVIDAGPFISHSSLPRVSSAYYTTPSVVAELKDASARERLELLRLQTEPAFIVRRPRPDSVAFVRGFATKTGDAAVLSAQDLEILALAYELELEHNGGDWRLRKAPGQKGINGRPPAPPVTSDDAVNAPKSELAGVIDGVQAITIATQTDALTGSQPKSSTTQEEVNDADTVEEANASDSGSTADAAVAEQLDADDQAIHDNDDNIHDDDDDDDEDGWITPGNISKHKAKQDDVSTVEKEERVMKVACATHDYAMQNVLLQIGLNLVSQDGKRIATVKTWVLRCYACFKTTRSMTTKFCPSCGGATLLRTSVSTDAKGQTKMHLKRNFQYRTRGTIYDIPQQKAGTSNMKGRDNLILRADQREVQKLEKREKYRKEVDLLDQDTLPSILSGDRRDHTAADLQVGYGRRNPNAVGRRRK